MTPLEFMIFLTGKDPPSSIKAVLGANEFMCVVRGSEPGGPARSVITVLGGSPKPVIVQVGNDLAIAYTSTPPFNTCVLPVTPFTDHLNIKQLRGIRLGLEDATDVMVTTRLNGCTLVYLPSTKERPYVMMAHLMPDANQDGAQLNQLLRRNRPFFENEDSLPLLFGRLDQSTPIADVNIIALRRKGQWTLYLQEYNQNGIGKVHVLPMYIV